MAKEPTIEQALGPSKAICIDCKQVKYLREFLINGTNIRMNCCTKCLEVRKGGAVAGLKALAEESRFRELVNASLAMAGPKHVCSIQELAGELIDQAGGLKKFANEWHKQLERAKEDKPGSKLVLDGYYAIAKLVATASESSSGNAYDDLTFEEIQAQLSDTLLGLYAPEEEPAGEEGAA